MQNLTNFTHLNTTTACSLTLSVYQIFIKKYFHLKASPVKCVFMCMLISDYMGLRRESILKSGSCSHAESFPGFKSKDVRL